MLRQRLRCWPSSEPALGQSPLWSGSVLTVGSRAGTTPPPGGPHPVNGPLIQIPASAGSHICNTRRQTMLVTMVTPV